MYFYFTICLLRKHFSICIDLYSLENFTKLSVLVISLQFCLVLDSHKITFKTHINDKTTKYLSMESESPIVSKTPRNKTNHVTLNSTLIQGIENRKLLILLQNLRFQNRCLASSDIGSGKNWWIGTKTELSLVRVASITHIFVCINYLIVMCGFYLILYNINHIVELLVYSLILML